MSWGTTYILHDYMSRVSMSDVDDREMDEDVARRCWDKILALAAMSPRDVVTEDGVRLGWADYILHELRQLREDLEDSWRSLAQKDILSKVLAQGRLHVRLCANGHAFLYDPESRCECKACPECGAEFMATGTMASYREG